MTGIPLEPPLARHVTDLPTQKLLTIARALDQKAEAVLASRTDFSTLEGRVLAFIEARAPVSVSDVATGMFMDTGQTSRIVSSLTRKGYVHRGANDRDQRSTLLGLSPRGKIACERMLRSTSNWNRRILAALSPEDIAPFQRSLDKILDFLASLEADTA